MLREHCRDAARFLIRVSGQPTLGVLTTGFTCDSSVEFAVTDPASAAKIEKLPRLGSLIWIPNML